jgi:hypothetical protein
MYNQEGEEEANMNKISMVNVSKLRSAETWTRGCKEKAKT